MTRNPRVVHHDAKAVEALDTMNLHPPVSFLPVVSDSQLTLSGMVCLADLVAVGL